MKELHIDVLILGSGIAAYTAAYELEQKGVSVLLCKENTPMNHVDDQGENEGVVFTKGPQEQKSFAQDLHKAAGNKGCPRAIDHIVSEGEKVLSELVVKELGVCFDTTAAGEIAHYLGEGHTEGRLVNCSGQVEHVILSRLQQLVDRSERVMLVTDKKAVELITLADHSTKGGDHYKKPTCAGAILQDKDGEHTAVFAKETIVATGGVKDLFLHGGSCHMGEGIAVAQRAGARVIRMDMLQMQPLAWACPGQDPIYLPECFRTTAHSRLLNANKEPFMESLGLSSDATGEVIAAAAYQELMNSGAKNLWLQLSESDLPWLQACFPSLFKKFEKQGINVSSDPIPVIPVVKGTLGGIVVDRFGATTVHRLRAIGRVACTGVNYRTRLSGVSILESLVWGTTTAKDIAKQIVKFAYYTPRIADIPCLKLLEPARSFQDTALIRQTLWNFLGNNSYRRRRAESTLKEMEWELEELLEKGSNVQPLANRVRAALLITRGC